MAKAVALPTAFFHPQKENPAACAEHKSTNRDNVFLLISEYYHHLFLEREKDVPVVAFIVYNGEDGWDAIDDAELKALSPITLVALTAMKYICAKAQYTAPRSYRQVHLPLRLSA